MKVMKRSSIKIMTGIILLFVTILTIRVPDSYAEQPKATMIQAVMCESIEDYLPINPAVVFSTSQGEVFCFSNFDPVLEKTFIVHKWYKQDKLVFTMRLVLSPPKWSSFSRIQIRDADKGPWRVEISDADDKLLKILRFSMADD
jgi:hypothetical protein